MLPSFLNLALPLAQADDESVIAKRFVTQPQLPAVLLAVGFLVAAAAAIYLYRAQSKVASKRIIYALATIRTLLILLMFGVLLGPGCQFTHRGTANGTLWLLLDRSASMAQLDAQATPLEKLRWADAAGLLPADARPSALDRQAARLAAMAKDVEHWRSALAVPVEDAVARKKLDAVVAGLKRWNAQLTTIADAVEKDPRGKDDQTTIKALRGTIASTAAGIDKIDARSNPVQAVADLDWKAMESAAVTSAAALRASADKFDKELIAKNDPRVKDASERVSRLSREQLARLALVEKPKRPPADGAKAAGFDALLPKQNVKIIAFGDATQTIIPERDNPKKAIDSALANPDKPATDLVAALRSAAEQIGQDETASVVILGDGRQNRGTTAELAEAARRLAGRGVRTYAVAFGSEQVVPDAAVESLDAPDWVFKGDTIKISALLRLDGLAGKTIDVELHRKGMKDGPSAAATLVDAKQVTVPAAPAAAGGQSQVRQVVTFNEKKDALPEAGVYDYEVRIKDVPDEAIKENNAWTSRVSVREDKLTVLMIEDQPRWEFRYVQNYFMRDARVRLQTMLLQPASIGRGAKGETVTPPPPCKPSADEEQKSMEFQILPDQQEEWYQWKFIVLGDVPPDSIPRKTQEMIVKAVTDGGATLLVMAGPLNMPMTWGNDQANFPIAQLFPVEPNPEWTPQIMQSHLRLGYRPMVAADGNGHLLTQFGIDEVANDKIWATLRTDPDLNWYWHSEMTQAKGAANVIWSIADADPTAGRKAATRPAAGAPSDPTAMEDAQKRALLATMNVGLGKVMYLGGDATWRLRQVNGQNLHERFWGQVVRWVVGSDLPAGGRFVRFGTDKPRYVGGESAIVTARVVDKKSSPTKGQTFRVVARTVAAGTSGTTRPAGADAATKVEAEMTEIADAPGMYRAVLGNLPNGQVELSLVGGEVEALLRDDEKALTKTLPIEVQKSLNLEQRNVNPDRSALAAVAEAGGGAMLDAQYADVLADQIPELNYQTNSAEQIGLFTDATDKWSRRTHWAFLIVFLTLISAEWILRKVGGLV